MDLFFAREILLMWPNLEYSARSQILKFCLFQGLYDLNLCKF